MPTRAEIEDIYGKISDKQWRKIRKEMNVIQEDFITGIEDYPMERLNNVLESMFGNRRKLK